MTEDEAKFNNTMQEIADQLWGVLLHHAPHALRLLDDEEIAEKTGVSEDEARAVRLTFPLDILINVAIARQQVSGPVMPDQVTG
jgi:hypothetical protein